MGEDDRQEIKRKCGGSWKLVLRFLLAGELGCRREKSQALAGPGHSIAVTSKGVVYSFGSNTSGQLGQGTIEDTWQPRPIRLLTHFSDLFSFLALVNVEVCIEFADHSPGSGLFRQLLEQTEQC